MTTLNRRCYARGVSNGEAMLRIGAVAQMTGLPVDVIRIWERRYRVVVPQRDERGIRLYRESDVKRLTHVRRATEGGHAVGRVAVLSDEDLERLAAASQRDDASIPQAAAERIFAALRSGDPAAIEQALSAASMALDARVLALEVLAPVLRRTGESWEEGRLSVWQEHLLSWLVRNLTGSLMRTLPRKLQGALLFATPPFEAHEFGIGIAALLAAAHGRPTQNLGINVPAAELLHAARRLRPVCVVLGMAHNAQMKEYAVKYVAQLNRELPAKTALWLGGALGVEIAEEVASARVTGVATLEEFDRRVQLLAAGA